MRYRCKLKWAAEVNRIAIFIMLFSLITLICGSGQAWAQQKQGNTSQKTTIVPQDDSQGKKPSGTPTIAKTPPNCQEGQMRCVTNDHRWSAAIRHADGRAEQLRKSKGGEVK